MIQSELKNTKGLVRIYGRTGPGNLKSTSENQPWPRSLGTDKLRMTPFPKIENEPWPRSLGTDKLGVTPFPKIEYGPWPRYVDTAKWVVTLFRKYENEAWSRIHPCLRDLVRAFFNVIFGALRGVLWHKREYRSFNYTERGQSTFLWFYGSTKGEKPTKCRFFKLYRILFSEVLLPLASNSQKMFITIVLPM